MLKSLAFSVTFPPSEIFPEGRSFQRSVVFDEGMTSITGPNEEGKSLILEMIRFALFGSKALRGAADDYKTLKVVLNFAVKGEEWSVVRKATTTASLFRAGEEEPIVKGTKAVNLKIVELFGYGLAVFDASNAILQGEVEALGSMLPADRKRLVDSTIGLNIIDGLIDWTTLQGNNARVEAEALGGAISEPVLPELPAGYVPSEQVAKERDDASLLLQELRVLQDFLGRNVRSPVAPTCPVPQSAADLQTLVNFRRSKEQEFTSLTARHDAIPVASYTAEQLDAVEREWNNHDRWKEKATMEKAYPLPAISKDAISNHRGIFAHNERYFIGDSIRERIKKLKAKGQHECPKCQHTWDMEAEVITSLEADAAQYPAEAMVQTYTKAEIDAAERAWIGYDGTSEQRERLKDVTPPVNDRAPSLSRSAIQVQRAALERAQEKADLLAQIASFVLPDDVTGLWQERVRYDAAFAQYQKELAAYEVYEAEAAVKRVRAEELVALNLEERVKTLNEQWGVFKAYEMAMASYADAKTKYERNRKIVEEKTEEAEQFKRGVAALRDLKLRVKQYLIPSLNRVASTLLAQMTGGARRNIQVDEEFNILVDGQRLDTLSGSGKACANLAVRIGLGQVLTAKVFPVLMGDEIDAAMDADRGGYTAQAMRGLQKHLKQILLISHKDVDADHTIRLGEMA